RVFLMVKDLRLLRIVFIQIGGKGSAKRNNTQIFQRVFCRYEFYFSVLQTYSNTCSLNRINNAYTISAADAYRHQRLK
ncbi:MAG: hypothetical protein IKI80_04065, partial [Bacteroidaceae bacterium]|nr:hypothetical protein [Bacteroidaceae bacterium]